MIWANGPCLKCVKYIIAIQCRLHYNMEWAMQRKYQFITKGEYIQYIVAILILTLHRQGSGRCVVAASCVCFWVKLFVLLLTSVLVDFVSMCHRTCGDVLCCHRKSSVSVAVRHRNINYLYYHHRYWVVGHTQVTAMLMIQLHLWYRPVKLADSHVC